MPALIVAEGENEMRGTADALGQEAIAVAILDRAAGITLLSLFDNARLAALCAIWVAENLPPAAGVN